jgi:hypothetical protein
MRTRTNLSAKVSGGLLLAAAVLLLGILAVRFWPATPVTGGDPVASNAVETVPPDVAETLPPDVLALGTEVTLIGPEGMISRDEALDIARGSDPAVFVQGQIDAYLIELTGPDVYEGVKDRPIWLIKASGLSLDVFHPPMRPDGTRADVGPAHLAYIYIDALTGEWLTSAYSE